MGKSITLSCESHFTPRWFKKDSDNDDIIDLKYSYDVIFIRKATLNNIGEYYCYGSSLWKPKSFIAKSLVKVYG